MEKRLRNNILVATLVVGMSGVEHARAENMCVESYIDSQNMEVEKAPDIKGDLQNLFDSYTRIIRLHSYKELYDFCVPENFVYFWQRQTRITRILNDQEALQGAGELNDSFIPLDQIIMIPIKYLKNPTFVTNSIALLRYNRNYNAILRYSTEQMDFIASVDKLSQLVYKMTQNGDDYASRSVFVFDKGFLIQNIDKIIDILDAGVQITGYQVKSITSDLLEDEHLPRLLQFVQNRENNTRQLSIHDLTAFLATAKKQDFSFEEAIQYLGFSLR
jgi:hypothetical protein